MSNIVFVIDRKLDEIIEVPINKNVSMDDFIVINKLKKLNSLNLNKIKDIISKLRINLCNINNYHYEIVPGVWDYDNKRWMEKPSDTIIFSIETGDFINYTFHNYSNEFPIRINNFIDEKFSYTCYVNSDFELVKSSHSIANFEFVYVLYNDPIDFLEMYYQNINVSLKDLCIQKIKNIISNNIFYNDKNEYTNWVYKNQDVRYILSIKTLPIPILLKNEFVNFNIDNLPSFYNCKPYNNFLDIQLEKMNMYTRLSLYNSEELDFKKLTDFCYPIIYLEKFDDKLFYIEETGYLRCVYKKEGKINYRTCNFNIKCISSIIIKVNGGYIIYFGTLNGWIYKYFLDDKKFYREEIINAHSRCIIKFVVSGDSKIMVSMTNNEVKIWKIDTEFYGIKPNTRLIHKLKCFCRDITISIIPSDQYELSIVQNADPFMIKFYVFNSEFINEYYNFNGCNACVKNDKIYILNVKKPEIKNNNCLEFTKENFDNKIIINSPEISLLSQNSNKLIEVDDDMNIYIVLKNNLFIYSKEGIKLYHKDLKFNVNNIKVIDNYLYIISNNISSVISFGQILRF